MFYSHQTLAKSIAQRDSMRLVWYVTYKYDYGIRNNNNNKKLQNHNKKFIPINNGHDEKNRYKKIVALVM